jgi:hypothetical protein
VTPKRHKFVLLLSAVLAILILRGVYRGYLGPPLIKIVNNSRYDITGLFLRGKGFAESVGQIPSGASKKIIVRPLGESDVLIEFVANGQRFANDDLGYIESFGGACIEVGIDEQLAFKISSNTSLCFSIRRSLW